MVVQIRLLADTKKKVEDAAKALGVLGYAFSPVEAGRKGDFICYGKLKKHSSRRLRDGAEQKEESNEFQR